MGRVWEEGVSVGEWSVHACGRECGLVVGH